MKSVFGLKKVWMRRRAARGAAGVLLSAAFVVNLLAGGMTAHALEERLESYGAPKSTEAQESALGNDSAPEKQELGESHICFGEDGEEGQPEGGEENQPEGGEVNQPENGEENQPEDGEEIQPEDGEENRPEDRIGDLEDLIAALPDEVTPDNADAVRKQLEEILALFAGLTEEEQEQIDISHCLELQEALESGLGEQQGETARAAAGAYSLAAEGSGEIDFSQGTDLGDLETDHYRWDANSKKLQLKNATINQTVILPDATVTIETEGECYIEMLTIAGQNPQNTQLIFSGIGEQSKLTIQKRIEVSGGAGNSIVVQAHTHVMANGGISIGESGVNSVVTVYGILTVRGESFDTGDGTDYHNAISAGKVVVGAGGVLNVSGENGVMLYGMNDGAGCNVADAFTIEKGGCFTANCVNFNVKVVQFAGNAFSGNGEDQAISLPDKDAYLPTDCDVRIQGSEVDFVKKGTDTVYTGPMSIHENHDWPDRFDEKDECRHWKKCTFEGCDKTDFHAVHSFGDSAQKCPACDAVLDVTLSDQGLVYNGQEQKPVATVKVDNTELDSSKYHTAYSNNANAGEASATITGTDGPAFTRTIPFRIAKATPAITWGGDSQTVVYSGSQAKIAPPTVTLVNGESFKGEVIYSYAANSRAGYTPGLPTNAGTYSVKASIGEQGNYTAAESGTVTLTVEQAEHPLPLPSKTMNVARKYDKVGIVEGLPKDWQWQESDKDTALEIEVPLTATAVYVGEDKDNYKNVTYAVTIIRADCGHERTEVRNKVEATCQQKGYSGDTWCLDCGELVAPGTQTDYADHKGGTATCISGRICTVCGTEYGEKDSANHVNKEIRGQKDATCTEEGYTGDEFCADCGTKISSGTVVAAAGHDWHVTSEEKPTATSEGKRTYTCSKCGETREESIPKLPEESHRHDYKRTVEKEASCTEAGIRRYVCSCGDSYTESIPALGHSYRSEVTKQPTVFEEGVSTYVCIRCGYSYTKPIQKLADTASEPESGTMPLASAEVESPKTGQPWIPWWVMAADALAIAMGIGACRAVRRKRAERDR